MILHSSLKEYILTNYNQEKLYAKYLGLPLEEIEEAIENNRNIINTLRASDTIPSLRLSYFNNKLRMWDFGNSLFRGDIFDLVGIALQKDSNNPIEFVEICKHIINNEKIDIKIISKIPSSTLTIIDYLTKPFNRKDIDYWLQGGVTTKHLSLRGVSPVKSIYVNKTGKPILYYTYSTNDPAYVYRDCVVDKTELVKIYRPFASKKDKFITNNKYLFEGINELYSSDILIITKSRKDKLVLEVLLDDGSIVKNLDKLVRSFNLPSYIDYPFLSGFYQPSYALHKRYCITNLTAESVFLGEKIVSLLRVKHKKIIINYDYDLTGIFNAFIYYKVYDITPLFIGRNATKIIDSLNDSLLKLLKNKLNTYDINFKEKELTNFIIEHGGEYEEKDWFELASNNIINTKFIINE